MKRLALALLSAGTVLAPSATLPARAAAFGPGLVCGMVTLTDPTAEPHTQSGVLVGGPILTSLPSVLTCSIQVNAPTHAGTDSAAVSGPATTGVAVAVGVAPLNGPSYGAVPDDTVYLCTQLDYDGTRYYWDAANDGLGGGAWTTSSAADCQVASAVHVSNALDPLAPVVCPLLGGFLPPALSGPLRIQAGCVEGEGQVVRLVVPFPAV